MSRVRANKITNNAANGAPQLTFGTEVIAGVGITGAGSINITGVVTAASFSGDGSGLSGIDATALKDSGGSVKVQANTSGIVVTGVATATTFSGNVTGVAATFTGNVSVGGVLTYEDVTNVDSVGLITARSGIRIGAGQSVSAVSGIVTYYGDGSQLTGVESGVGNFVASGTIPNGATVVIKTDGTVGIVTLTGSATPSAGTPVVFNSGMTEMYDACTFDSTNGKVIIAYRDNANSEYGTAIVGTVSGTSISFGSEVVFESATTTSISLTYDSTNERVVIAYRDVGNSARGTAIVGTVSGTSISFGTAVVFESGDTQSISAIFDSTNGKVVIAYMDAGNSDHTTAIVGTVSGSSISFGSANTFYSATTTYVSAAYDSTNSKVIIAWGNTSGTNGRAVVGTVSGTSISFGSTQEFESDTTSFISTIYDSTNGKIVIAYRDDSTDHGKAIVGTVSGSNISFGSAVTFNTASSTYINATFDSTNGTVVIVYNDAGNSNYGTAIIGTVSGTSISFGNEVVFESAVSNFINNTYDSTNNKVVIAYRDGGNSNYGTAVVFSATSQTTNLTAENYIGIAAEAIANTATGKINILGGVNTGQTGLTTAQTYFVQTNGTLATSAGSPSVVAGTSISNTKILIR